MENISETSNMVKEWWAKNQDSVCWGTMVFLGVLLAGGLLRLIMVWQEQSSIAQIGEEHPFSEEVLYNKYLTASGFPGLVAASRNGKRYYYPWCGGLARIKESNKIWFSSIQAAEAAGYTIAAGCDGL